MEKGPLLGAGRTADVFAWGDERVLKLYQGWMPAPPIEREFAITRLAGQAGLPVPAAEEILQVDGRLGIVFERIRGDSLLKRLESRPLELIPISRLLAELHARMHDCRLPAGTASQREQIEQGLGWAKELTETERQSIRGLLSRLPDGDALCHGDFHPDNILITERGPVIIDWMNGRGGHPLGDVARTALLIQQGGLPPRVTPAMRLAINASRRLVYSVYIKRYLQIHPAPRSEIGAWKVPLLAARLFEVAEYPREKSVILQQIRAVLN
jgi:aminoglycoside phosphotransferase (APT) family kinase protein